MTRPCRELSNDTGKARSAHRVEGAFPFHTHGLHERSCGDLCAYENSCAQRFPRDEGVCAPWGNIAHLFSSRFALLLGHALRVEAQSDFFTKKPFLDGF